MMPTPTPTGTGTGKSNRPRGTEEKSRRGKLSQRASSFHGASSALMAARDHEMIRPRTVPDLLSGMRDQKGASSDPQVTIKPPPKLTKLLLNVTIQGSVGAVQVLVAPESRVGDLIGATVRQYVKEGRRPFLTSHDASAFDLHYSQFSLESLDRDEKLIDLGSRNFFLCTKMCTETEDGSSGVGASASRRRCSEEPVKNKNINNNIPPWLKFMDFLIYHKGV